MNNISNKFKKLIVKINLYKKHNSDDEVQRYLENAKKEMNDAMNIFENVTDPELIDFAIYKIDAAEKKYGYYIKKIKSGSAI